MYKKAVRGIALCLLVATIFLVIIITAGCEAETTGAVMVESEPKLVNEYANEPAIYFCPQDNCEQVMLDLLYGAEKSIHCALHDLDLSSMINFFESRINNTDVRVIIDDRYQEELEEYPFIKFDNSNQLTHNKFCVIDNRIMFTGSTNPTYNGVEKNNNNLIVLNSKQLIDNYQAEFDELYAGVFGGGAQVMKPKVTVNGKVIENYFCPEDNCKKHVQDVLQSANESIYFMTFAFTDMDIATDLAFADMMGLDVKGVYEARQAGSKHSTFQLLRHQEVPVVIDANPATMHHKVFIVDKKIVITGSYNPSRNGNERNDENILIFHDEAVAQKFLDEFNTIWDEAIRSQS